MSYAREGGGGLGRMQEKKGGGNGVGGARQKKQRWTSAKPLEKRWCSYAETKPQKRECGWERGLGGGGAFL